MTDIQYYAELGVTITLFCLFRFIAWRVALFCQRGIGTSGEWLPLWTDWYGWHQGHNPAWNQHGLVNFPSCHSKFYYLSHWLCPRLASRRPILSDVTPAGISAQWKDDWTSTSVPCQPSCHVRHLRMRPAPKHDSHWCPVSTSNSAAVFSVFAFAIQYNIRLPLLKS